MLHEDIRHIFEEEQLQYTALLPFSECRLTLPHLLEREKEITPHSVILFLIPYYFAKPDNFSAYAAARDYHLYLKQLSERMRPKLEALFPGYRFLSFSDHSPIDERHAAVRGGLGIYGCHGLLLTEAYSSYQFIGEWITDAPLDLLGESDQTDTRTCPGCGACKAACPTGILRGEGEECLSAITQKKGDLTQEEQALILTHNTLWGCDICQEACPYTRRALASGSICSPIPFFKQQTILHLDTTTLSSLSASQFKERAFAWRGKATIARNIRLFEEQKKKTEK